MSANPATSLDEAIAWHLKLPHLSDEQWPDFVSWLEHSPENRAQYDQLAAADFLAGQVECVALGEPEEAVPDTAARRRPFVPMAIAASLALAVAVWAFRPVTPALSIEQTLPGDTRQVARAEGTVITLNGDSRIVLDESDPRSAVLERGEALFSVRHSDKPFEVTAAGVRIRDLGTVFNVRLTGGNLHVAVREGTVILDPGGANLRIDAGEAISFNPNRNLAIKSRTAQVGTWVSGELVFEDARVQDLVDALHRRSGIEVKLPETLSNAPFTGNIRLSGDEAADVAHLATLLGADYRREGKVWQLSARGTRR